MYFKYKNDGGGGDAVNEKSKMLQVFTHMLQIGSKDLVMTTVRDMSYWLELER